jgi:hypothetical protein
MRSAQNFSFNINELVMNKAIIFTVKDYMSDSG